MIDIGDTRRLTSLRMLLLVSTAVMMMRAMAFVPVGAPSSSCSSSFSSNNVVVSSRCCRGALAAPPAGAGAGGAGGGAGAARGGRRRRRRGGSCHDDTTAVTTTTMMMASSVAPPARTKAEKTSEVFKLKDGGMVEFGSGQRVEASIAGAPLKKMQEYVSDPSRIVFACWEHEDITRMGDGVFRMAFRGQSFLSISIDMSVDIRLWTAEDGTIQCKSIGYSVEDMAKILGQDFVDTFFLELEGELRVKESVTKVRALTLKNTLLSGEVEVTIGGKLPGLVSATPEPLVKSAALGINNKVLEYVSNTFISTVAGDYRKWAREQKQG